MYLKKEAQCKIIEKAKDIQRVATLETCGISELVKLYHENYQVKLWFDTWIVKQANDIEKLLTE